MHFNQEKKTTHDHLPPTACSGTQGTPEQQAEAAGVLVAVLEAVRIVAVGLAPLTPALSARIYAQLGFSEEQYKVR